MLGGDLTAALGLPADVGAAPTSAKRFPDGGHYRIEIPSVEGPLVCAAVLEEAESRGLLIHRVSQGSGVTMLSTDERDRWARQGAAHQLEISLYVRPTASWGSGAAWLSPTGHPLAGQVHGLTQLGAALDQVRRAVRSGFRSVLVTDIGVIDAIAQLKERGDLPRELSIKAGVQLGVANPMAARVVERLGASTINVPSDLSLVELAAIRAAVDVPLDIYIEAPDDLGGFIRVHEIADIVRVAAPVYLKFGLRNAPPLYPSGTHTEALAATLARERVRRSQLGIELLHEVDDSLAPSRVSSDLAVPQPPTPPS